MNTIPSTTTDSTRPAFRTVVEASDLFAAFAPSGSGQIGQAGLDYLEENPDVPYEPRPVMLMLGEKDPKLTYAAGVEAFSMDESGAEEGNALNDIYIDPYLELMGLEDSYTYERTKRVSHFTFDQPIDPEGNYEFHLLVIENLLHTYPNGNNYPIDIANPFWDFFEQFTL